MLRNPESVEEGRILCYLFLYYSYTSRGRSSSPLLLIIKLKLKDYEQYKENSKYIL